MIIFNLHRKIDSNKTNFTIHRFTLITANEIIIFECMPINSKFVGGKLNQQF